MVKVQRLFAKTNLKVPVCRTESISIAAMRYGVWLLIFLRKEQMQMKLVLAEKPSVAQSIAKVLGATKREYNRSGRKVISYIGCNFFMNSIDKKTWYVYD